MIGEQDGCTLPSLITGFIYISIPFTIRSNEDGAMDQRHDSPDFEAGTELLSHPNTQNGDFRLGKWHENGSRRVKDWIQIQSSVPSEPLITGSAVLFVCVCRRHQ